MRISVMWAILVTVLSRMLRSIHLDLQLCRSRKLIMADRFFFDPLEGEKEYSAEHTPYEHIRMLPRGKEYLYAEGRVEFTPKQSLIVGGCYDIRIRYFPEKQELPVGTRVSFSIPRTWTQPQSEDEWQGGFVLGRRSNGGACKLHITHNHDVQWWINLEIAEKEEPPEGWVGIDYSNATIQRFPQEWFWNWRSAMQTAVFSQATKEYTFVRAERTEKPTIIPAPPARFNVASPAVIARGDQMEVKFSTLDYCDNAAYPSPVGKVFLSTMDKPLEAIMSTELQTKDRGHSTFRLSVGQNSESVRFIVSNKKDNLTGISQSTIIKDNTDDLLNVYFGDIHGHTMLSDGLKSPDDYFTHARDVALMDFGAITDHNGLEASRTEGPFAKGMSDETFRQIQQSCESFNDPGHFVTIQGFEQNVIEGYPGHRNIYFRDICPGLFRGNTLEELYAHLEGHDALIISHHPIIWDTKVHLDNFRYERVLEMYSMHCSSEFKGTPINNYETSFGKTETGVSAQNILDMGYRVGFIAGSDNHNGAPGLSARPSRFTNLTYKGGIAAVLAPRLTRQDIFDGLYNRQCYATTGARIYLDFRLDNRIMGSEITCKQGDSIPYEIVASGTDRIASIELIQNGRKTVLHTYDGRDHIKLSGEYKCDTSMAWMYVRVTQVDRNMAWSSPMWLDIV